MTAPREACVASEHNLQLEPGDITGNDSDDRLFSLLHLSDQGAEAIDEALIRKHLVDFQSREFRMAVKLEEQRVCARVKERGLNSIGESETQKRFT
jgi:hypothetical protein